MVAAWAGYVEPAYRKEDGVDEVAGVTSVTVFLRNASPVPVTGVTIALSAPYQDHPVYGTVGFQHLHVLAPGDAPIDRVFVLKFPERYNVDPDREFLVRLTFRDAAGQLWRRESNGILEPHERD